MGRWLGASDCVFWVKREIYRSTLLLYEAHKGYIFDSSKNRELGACPEDLQRQNFAQSYEEINISKIASNNKHQDDENSFHP